MEERGTVRAVERALDILLCFAGTEMELGLSDISRKVNLHKSTVHRLLASLEYKGFIRRNPDSEKYRLGWSILELLSNVYQSDDLASIVVPEMTRLRDQLGETISLYIRSGIERIRTQAVESNQPVRRVANIGERMSLSVGAAGKVLLAWEKPSVIEEILHDPLWHSSVSEEEFLDALEKVRQLEFAISIEERELGAAAVSVPIFGRDGNVVAALSVAGPVDRFSPAALDLFIPTAKNTAEVISKLLTR